MFRVDVDAHVDESEATWEYLDDGVRRFKPATLDPGGPTAPGDARPHRLWVIDGNIRLRDVPIVTMWMPPPIVLDVIEQDQGGALGAR